MTYRYWYKTDLADIIKTIESGNRPKGGVSSDSGEIPSLGGENILQKGGITLKSIKKVPVSFYLAMKKGILHDLDVLINKDGANTGKVGLFKKKDIDEGCINEHVFLLRGYPNKIQQEFLYYLLLWEASQRIIKSKISGSAQPGLASSFIKNFPVIIPKSIQEQTQIATILSTIDKAIEQTEAIIAKQQRIKTGLMQDLLTKGIDEHGNIRSEATHKFKDSPLGRIPVEWKISKLGALAHLITSGSRGWAKYYSDEGAIFITDFHYH